MQIRTLLFCLLSMTPAVPPQAANAPQAHRFDAPASIRRKCAAAALMLWSQRAAPQMGTTSCSLDNVAGNGTAGAMRTASRKQQGLLRECSLFHEKFTWLCLKTVRLMPATATIALR